MNKFILIRLENMPSPLQKNSFPIKPSKGEESLIAEKMQSHHFARFGKEVFSNKESALQWAHTQPYTAKNPYILLEYTPGEEKHEPVKLVGYVETYFGYKGTFENVFAHISDTDVRVQLPQIQESPEDIRAQEFQNLLKPDTTTSTHRSTKIQELQAINPQARQPSGQDSVFQRVKLFFSESQKGNGLTENLQKSIKKFEEYAKYTSPEKRREAEALSLELNGLLSNYKTNNDIDELITKFKEKIEREKPFFSGHRAEGDYHLRKPRGERRLNDILAEVDKLEQVANTNSFQRR